MDVLYKNIKNRRLQLKLTQLDLAQLVGYTDRSSIAKIESGVVDMNLSKVEDFARALGTTPTALMGWDNSEGDYFIDGIVVEHHRRSSPAQRLGSLFNNLSIDGQEKLIEYADMLNKSGYVKDDSEEPPELERFKKE